MSKVIILCYYKNSYVHASNGTIHQNKEEDITSTVGKNGLSAEYSGLFTGKVQRLLKDDGINKYQFLNSVRNAWDRVKVTAGLGGWECNQIAATFIQIHKMRRIQKLEK